MSTLSHDLFLKFRKRFTRELTHKKSKLVDSCILNYESVFKLVNKVFWFAMGFLHDRELHKY